MGERVCIVIYEGGCAFVQTLNVTDALWVDKEKMCVCVCLRECAWRRLAAYANTCLQKSSFLL